MRRLLSSFYVILLSVTITCAQNDNFIHGTVIVKYSSEKAASNHIADFEYLCKTKARKTCKLFNTEKKDSPSANISRIFRIEYDGDESPIVIAKKMAQCEGVEYAQPYWIPELFDTPDDPKTGSQYYLQLVKAFDAYDISKGDSNIVIGIIDTGVDIYHEDLASNIKINYNDPINGIDDDGDGYIDNYRGWDLGCDDNNPISSVNHHGTYVAGIAAATANNGIGIAGVGYNTKFMPIKVSEDTEGSLIACYEGIVYAADHGCKIINCSWGSTSKNPLCDDVVKYAQDKGCLIVAAAGNTGTDVKYYPASCEGVISVAGTNSADKKWSKSTFNNMVDISAPGEGIYSTTYNSTYNSGNGTSFASPIVAAAAALVWAHRPELTATQVGELLRVTTDNIDTIPANSPYKGKIGSGRLNIFKAMNDTVSPSIRITDCTFKSEFEEFVSGSELTTSITVCNYLKQVSDVTVTLVSPDNRATINNATTKIDWIGTNESRELNFMIALSDTLPENSIIPFCLHFDANRYSAYQYIELLANPTFKDIEWGDLKSTVADNGKLGIYDYDAQLGNGFLYKNKYNLFSDGAIILALDNEKIASAFQNDNQFKCVEKPAISKNDGVAHIKSVIKPDNISGITVMQDFIFDGANLPTAMICDYKIINSRDESFDNGALGLYFDWDIVNSLTNKIDYDANRRMSYIYNTGDDNIYGGVCLITDGKATPYAFEFSENGSSMNITDKFTDEQKWEAMNYARQKSTSTNIDLGAMLTFNNMKLESGDTAEVKFAIMAGENLYELNKTADRAAELYNSTKSSHLLDRAKPDGISLYPNPAISTIHISQQSAIEQINIYNVLGHLVFSQKNNSSTADIDISRLADGNYIVEIVNTDGRTSHRLVAKQMVQD